MIYEIIVIGGGPAGMTAAIKAKETAPSASVKLIDKNKKLGNKRLNLKSECKDMDKWL